METTSSFNKYLYYGIIVVVSLIMLFFLPMLGSEVGLTFIIPNTVAGWIVWTLCNLASAGLNLLLFHAFIKQGKLNILAHPNYVEANNLLNIHKISRFIIPLSPAAWHSREYRKKGVWLAIGTLIGVIGLSNAFLVFNWVRFLTQLFSLVFAIIFGFMEMKSVEEYWTIEYLEYAKYTVHQKEEEELANQTTNYTEITETTITERTREIPIKENTNDTIQRCNAP